MMLPALGARGVLAVLLLPLLLLSSRTRCAGVAVPVSASVLETAEGSKQFDCKFLASYPRQYVAYKTETPLVVDGSLDEPGWEEVDWTEDFVDISTSTKPWLATRAKIRWDDDFLYVGAHLEEPNIWANISSTCHCYDPNENQVIFSDNDFEIFVDTDGSTHYYKEFEMNAANATWDLCLNKPYDDHGYENSTRVYGDKGFDMQPPLHCQTHVNGTLNDPTAENKYWTAEVALPLSKLSYNKTNPAPKDGSVWRINFSRVEWHIRIVNGRYVKEPSCQSCPVPGGPHEDNWVWSPQGSIAMHLPEHWGILQFSTTKPNATQPQYYEEWPVRSVAMAVYYAEHAYFAKHKKYTGSVALLQQYAPDHFLDGTCTKPVSVVLTQDGFSAAVTDGQYRATVQQDRLLVVKPVAEAL